jgi:hypothetical protein
MPDLTPSDFHLFGLLKNHLGGKRLLMTKMLKRGAEVAKITVEGLLCCRF